MEYIFHNMQRAYIEYNIKHNIEYNIKRVIKNGTRKR